MPLPKEPFLRNYRLLISTLSPIHIGCGEDYEPTHYLMHGGVLYTFDPVAALASDAPARDKLLEIVNRQQGEETIRKIQNFFYQRKETLIPEHRHRMPVGEGIQAFYDKRIGTVTQADTKAVNKLHIERTAFVSTNDQAIMPGSSLKGAIRTALLDAVHAGKPLVDKRGAENGGNSWKGLSPINETLRDCLPKEFERDPMRLIRVGDAYQSETSEHNGVFFAVNRKSSGVKGRGPYQTLECLSPMRLESFIADLSLLDTEQARKYNDVQADNKKLLPPRHLQWDATAITQRCNKYYKEQLLREITEMNGLLHADWAKTLRQSLEGGNLERLMIENKAFLLRVGRHSGAESVTLNGARHIKIMQGGGRPPKWGPGATTIWLAARNIEQENDLLPFGWLLVELVEIDDCSRRPLLETAPELAKLANMFKNDRTDRLKVSDDYLVSLRQKKDARLQEMERRKTEDDKRQAEEEIRQEQLAKMTPNQRKIEKLRESIHKTPHPQPISGQLWQDVGKLVKEAAAWPAEEKAELARVCREELPGKLNVDKKRLQSLQDTLLT
ncbi:MAG: type III-A CRISPR-associated RAMP protein Csm5 [Magnetococcales bacterium]|nr:type III-A CRISPR-associated RAMP protein Csm5 [Magnetococcales bacterium]